MLRRGLSFSLLPCVLGILAPLSAGCDAAPPLRPAVPPQQFAGPPGTVTIRFRSSEPDRRWTVFAYETPICVTPCDRWLDPSTALTMRSESGIKLKNSVNVPDLPPGAAGGPPITVRAYPASYGLNGLGVTLATLGGGGAAAGIALAAVGCNTSNQTMCVGGGITIPASLAVLVPGIYFIVRSAARAEVLGPEGEGYALGPFEHLIAGPGFVSGSF